MKLLADGIPTLNQVEIIPQLEGLGNLPSYGILGTLLAVAIGSVFYLLRLLIQSWKDRLTDLLATTNAINNNTNALNANTAAMNAFIEFSKAQLLQIGQLPVLLAQLQSLSERLQNQVDGDVPRAGRR